MTIEILWFGELMILKTINSDISDDDIIDYVLWSPIVTKLIDCSCVFFLTCWLILYWILHLQLFTSSMI